MGFENCIQSNDFPQFFIYTVINMGITHTNNIFVVILSFLMFAWQDVFAISKMDLVTFRVYKA